MTLDEELMIDAEAYAFAYGVSMAVAIDVHKASDDLARLEAEYVAQSPLPAHAATLEFYDTPEAEDLYARAHPPIKRSKPVQVERAWLYLARATLHGTPGHARLGKFTAARLVNGALALLVRQLADPDKRSDALAVFCDGDEGDAD